MLWLAGRVLTAHADILNKWTFHISVQQHQNCVFCEVCSAHDLSRLTELQPLWARALAIDCKWARAQYRDWTIMLNATWFAWWAIFMSFKNLPHSRSLLHVRSLVRNIISTRRFLFMKLRDKWWLVRDQKLRWAPIKRRINGNLWYFLKSRIDG